MNKDMGILSKYLILPIIRSICRYSVLELEKLSTHKQYIFASNHPSGFDPLLLYAILVPQMHRNLCVLLHSYFYDMPILNQLAKSWQAVRVNPITPSVTISDSLKQVHIGNNILIFPEGNVNEDSPVNFAKAHTGAVQLAIQTGLPIVPVCIQGTYKYWKFPHTAKQNKLSVLKFNPFTVVVIRFGKPISYSKYNVKLDKYTQANRKLLRSLTLDLMKQIKLMMK